MKTLQTILATLQNAWGPPVVSVALVESLRVQSVGVSMEHCETHLPPFDAVETKDTRRPGWIRSDCRLCGRFIGYRPADGDGINNVPKLGPYIRKPV